MSRQQPVIMVTNDDGVYSKGLGALIEAVRHMGKIVVVAPADGQSGMSHAITVRHPVRVERLDGRGEIEFYKVWGTPVDCVKIAFSQLLPSKPDLVVSGINHGGNSSMSVIYSGTMAAAIESCINGVPAIGFSLLDFLPDADFSASIRPCSELAQKVLTEGLPYGVCLNVNIPAVPEKELKGLRYCRQTKGHWIEEFEKRVDPHGRDYFWLTGNFNNLEPDAIDTDEWALANNYIAVVPVQTDLTCYSYLAKYVG